MKKNLKIGIIGAGAIGGITAALLTEVGYDVELVCKHKEISELANTRGIKISGIITKMIKVKSVERIEQLSGPKDVYLIATKAYDMVDSAKKLISQAKEESLFVSMQNGICTDALCEIVGENRTVGCVVGFGATMNGFADLEKTSNGDFIIGRVDKVNDKLMGELQEALNHVTTTYISNDIFCELYSKLIINSCITSLGAICGLHLGQMLKIKRIRKIFIEIIREFMDVANEMRITIPPYAGKIDYYQMSKRNSGFASFKRHLIIRVVGIKYRKLKSSSLQSLERGGRTEIDFFNGYISKKGKELNVITPINDKIVMLIKEIENKKRDICLDNFNDQLFINIK